jgi:hypothetical protein
LRIAQTSVYCDLGEYRLTLYAIIAKSKHMFMTERKSPPAAALPPSAAEPAAGIASTPKGSIPCEALPMPAAPFPEASPVAAVRQHAIAPGQCRWILADEDCGADALMCAAPTEARRSFCAAHCARVYEKEMEDEAEPEAEGETETEDPEAGPDEAFDGHVDGGIQA